MQKLIWHKIHFLTLILGLFIFISAISGCGKKGDETAIAPPPPAEPVQTSKVEEPEKEIPVYVYKADRLRDPFMPVGFTNNYQPDAIFDPQRATLKAIIFGTKTRTAAISVGGGGTYFIKAGKIFDIMGKIIEGFKAQVLVNKVVFQSDSGEIFELKIRETEEEKT